MTMPDGPETTHRVLVMGELTPEQRAAKPDRWELLGRGEGRVTRDPAGRLHLEVALGAATWSAPMPEHTWTELAADAVLAGLEERK